MPQPLSRVIPNGEFVADPNVLDDKPEFAKLVASIFAHASYIERCQGLLLVRVLGADAAPAIAMFSTLTAQHLQLGALEAAAKAALTPHEFDVFATVTSTAERSQGDRHKLAHWIWGRCPQLKEEALLLANPKTDKERDLALMQSLQNVDDEAFWTAETWSLDQTKPDSVLVYRRPDLERVKCSIAQGAKIAHLLVVYLDDVFTGRRKPLPGSDPQQMRDLLFEMLCDVPP